MLRTMLVRRGIGRGGERWRRFGELEVGSGLFAVRGLGVGIETGEAAGVAVWLELAPEGSDGAVVVADGVEMADDAIGLDFAVAAAASEVVIDVVRDSITSAVVRVPSLPIETHSNKTW
jgi:hypothetical protein